MLWIDFVNSNWYDHLTGGVQVDRLEDAAWMREIAKRAGVSPQDLSQPKSLEALRRLRAFLTRVVGKILARTQLGNRELTQLNRYLDISVRPRVKHDSRSFSLHLEPTEKGVDQLLFAVASSFADFLVEGDLGRLKACANENCQWVFYDTTKSRTRRWCATNCGNLIKVRQFRSRRQEAEGRRQKSMGR